MKCPHCNQEHPDDSLFCPVTGRKMLRPINVCPQCGQPVDPKLSYCTFCGYQLIQPEPVPTPAAPLPTLAPPIKLVVSKAATTARPSRKAPLFLIAGGIGLVCIFMAILSISLLGYFKPAVVHPSATWTPSPTFTFEPTLTYTPIPTDTPLPTQALPAAICPPGSNRLQGRGVDMCLPLSWQGGSDQALDTVISTLNGMGSSGQKYAALLDSSRSTTIFWAFDTQESSVATNVNVQNDFASMPIAQFMQGECQQLPAYYQQQVGGTANCLETGLVALGNFTDIGRVVIEETISGTAMQAVQYLVKQGDTFWEITFTTDPSRYSAELPIFEGAISTLQINP